MGETLLQFFTVQNDLNVVRLELHGCNYEAVKEISFHVLRSCPRLQWFHFEFPSRDLMLKWEEVTRFFALLSKLQYLHLSFNVSEAPDKSSYEAVMRSLPPNDFALTTLALDRVLMNENLFATFLKKCPSLEYLKLPGASNCTLQTIFKYLVS